MKIKCLLGFHLWDGCECTTCGKTRGGGHEWGVDLTCTRCGKLDDGAANSLYLQNHLSDFVFRTGNEWHLQKYVARCDKKRLVKVLEAFGSSLGSSVAAGRFAGIALFRSMGVTERSIRDNNNLITAVLLRALKAANPRTLFDAAKSTLHSVDSTSRALACIYAVENLKPEGSQQTPPVGFEVSIAVEADLWLLQQPEESGNLSKDAFTSYKRSKAQEMGIRNAALKVIEQYEKQLPEFEVLWKERLAAMQIELPAGGSPRAGKRTLTCKKCFKVYLLYDGCAVITAAQALAAPKTLISPEAAFKEASKSPDLVGDLTATDPEAIAMIAKQNEKIVHEIFKALESGEARSWVCQRCRHQNNYADDFKLWR